PISNERECRPSPTLRALSDAGCGAWVSTCATFGSISPSPTILRYGSTTALPIGPRGREDGTARSVPGRGTRSDVQQFRSEPKPLFVPAQRSPIEHPTRVVEQQR